MNITQNFSLKNYNSFLIDVSAKNFVEILSESELPEFVESDLFKKEKSLLIGGGSNILFTKNFEGAVYKLNFSEINVVEESADEQIIEISAGYEWDKLVKYSVKNNLYGIENLAAIPGSVGAAPVQNIGAYGIEQENCFVSLKAFLLHEKEFISLEKSDCKFGYRDSVFKRELKGKAIVTNVRYKLSKIPSINASYSGVEKKLIELGVLEPSSSDIYNAITAIRKEKLPELNVVGSAGSFFKNPVIDKAQFESLIDEFPKIPNYPAENDRIKIAAAYLIEHCGWKGYRIGDAGVWQNQPLALVNFGQASGLEIYELAQRIIASVKNKFGIYLEPEANIV